MLLKKQKRNQAGFTINEVLIAATITVLVLASVAGLQYISSRTVKEIYGQSTVRAARLRAIDALRFSLSNAQIGSCVVASGNNRIEFVDPNLGGITSAFYFDGVNNILYYDEDVDDGKAATKVVKGPIDVTFELDRAGAVVILKVKTLSHMADGDVDIQDGETTVYLRNV